MSLNLNLLQIWKNEIRPKSTRFKWKPYPPSSTEILPKSARFQLKPNPPQTEILPKSADFEKINPYRVR